VIGTWFAVTCLALPSTVSGQTIIRSTTYANPEFGILLRVPGEGTLCPVPKDEHDHGLGILLGRFTVKDCHDDSRHRAIWLFAFFNALDETKHLPGLLKMGCDVAGGSCQPASTDLRIPGVKTSAARVDSPDGWTAIVVVAQAGVPSAYEPDVPSVNYLLHLRTKPQYLEEDLKIFRAILRTIKLSSEAK
jgi:hypothetical protein